MMELRQHIGFGMALYCFGAAEAMAMSAQPAELMLDGSPVEPYCMEHFFGDAPKEEPVNLRTCMAADVLPSEPAATNPDGDYGYEYSYRDTGEGMSHSYIYYRYIGRKDGLPVLLLKESGGGSGRFTVLVTVQRDGDMLKLVDYIASGDRCNGGLDASMKDGSLEFTQNITPIDFLELASDNPHQLSAYNDLEASASSCYGSARYRDGKLMDISLVGSGEDVEGWTENTPYQSCFNQLYRQYVKEGKTILNTEDLQYFTRNFNTTCVDNQ